MKPHLASIGLLAGSLVVALLLAEIALRLLGITYPSFFLHDPDRGVQHRPGAMGWWLKEGKSYVHINSDGLRDREHSFAKPPNIMRIAILGDSYAEAFQVEADDAFWAVMEKRLGHCAALSGKQVETINFGVSGYGTAKELITLREHVWKYQPDLVLLAFLTGNDIRDNSPILSHDPSLPYARLEDGNLVFHSSTAVPPSRTKRFLLNTGLLDRSYLAQTLYHIWRQLLGTPAVAVEPLDARRVALAARNAGFEFGLDDWVYTPPTTPDQKEAWLVTEALIRQMNHEVMAGGARFFLATLSNGIQVNPDRNVRETYKREMGATDLFYPDRRIAALAKTHGIQHLMLAPELRSWAETHRTCVHGFINARPCGAHWNEHGHREAGERMADAVCAMLGKRR